MLLLHTDTEYTHVHTATCFAGYSEGISIYKTGPTLDLIFTHKGHEAETDDSSVLTHSWHPSVTKLLVSTSTDGALHSWQWKHDNKSLASESVYKN